MLVCPDIVRFPRDILERYGALDVLASKNSLVSPVDKDTDMTVGSHDWRASSLCVGDDEYGVALEKGVDS